MEGVSIGMGEERLQAIPLIRFYTATLTKLTVFHKRIFSVDSEHLQQSRGGVGLGAGVERMVEDRAFAWIVGKWATAVGLGRELKWTDFHIVRDDYVASSMGQGSLVAWRWDSRSQDPEKPGVGTVNLTRWAWQSFVCEELPQKCDHQYIIPYLCGEGNEDTSPAVPVYPPNPGAGENYRCSKQYSHIPQTQEEGEWEDFEIIMLGMAREAWAMWNIIRL